MKTQQASQARARLINIIAQANQMAIVSMGATACTHIEESKTIRSNGERRSSRELFSPSGGLLMQSNRVNLLRMRWLWPVAVVLLTACGGGGDDGVGVGGSTQSMSSFVATLNGAQETPPNASTASGSGTATIDNATKVLTATVTTVGIVGTAAHIHNGAPGIAGPIVFPLTQTPAGSGNWSTTVTLTDDQFNLLKSGNYYFNVHNATFPNGEIRGQIVAQQPAVAGAVSGGAGGY